MSHIVKRILFLFMIIMSVQPLSGMDDLSKPYPFVSYIHNTVIPHLRSTMSPVYEDASDGFPYKGPIRPEFYGIPTIAHPDYYANDSTDNGLLDNLFTGAKIANGLTALLTVASKAKTTYDIFAAKKFVPVPYVPAPPKEEPKDPSKNETNEESEMTLDSLTLDELEVLAQIEEKQGRKTELFRKRYIKALLIEEKKRCDRSEEN
jgi:hypothetical protein